MPELPGTVSVTTKRRCACSMPDLMRDFGDQPQLFFLHRRGDGVAVPHGAKATLCGNPHSVQRAVASRLMNAGQQLIHRLEFGALGRDQSKHYAGVRGNFTQRLKRAGPPIVVLEEQPGEAARAGKHLSSDRFVASLADVVTLVIPAAQMKREGDTGDFRNRVDNL